MIVKVILVIVDWEKGKIMCCLFLLIEVIFIRFLK